MDAKENARERYFFTAGSSLTLWSYTTDHRLFDISTICDETNPDIELRKVNSNIRLSENDPVLVVEPKGIDQMTTLVVTT